jgi:hypothetical protein
VAAIFKVNAIDEQDKVSIGLAKGASDSSSLSSQGSITDSFGWTAIEPLGNCHRSLVARPIAPIAADPLLPGANASGKINLKTICQGI